MESGGPKGRRFFLQGWLANGANQARQGQRISAQAEDVAVCLTKIRN
jgi:hypothetical protein